MDENVLEDADIVAGFALGEKAVLESASYDPKLKAVLEATYKKKRVVRDGKVVVAQKRVSGQVRLSAAQRAGLKKARRTAHTAAAKLSFRKSMKARKQKGL